MDDHRDNSDLLSFTGTQLPANDENMSYIIPHTAASALSAEEELACSPQATNPNISQLEATALRGKEESPLLQQPETVVPTDASIVTSEPEVKPSASSNPDSASTQTDATAVQIQERNRRSLTPSPAREIPLIQPATGSSEVAMEGATIPEGSDMVVTVEAPSALPDPSELDPTSTFEGTIIPDVAEENITIAAVEAPAAVLEPSVPETTYSPEPLDGRRITDQINPALILANDAMDVCMESSLLSQAASTPANHSQAIAAPVSQMASDPNFPMAREAPPAEDVNVKVEDDACKMDVAPHDGHEDGDDSSDESDESGDESDQSDDSLTFLSKKLTVEEREKALIEVDAMGAEDEDGEKSGTGSVLTTKNELTNLPVIENTEVRVQDGVSLELVGTVSGIVDSVVVVQAACSGEDQVLDSDSLLFMEDRVSLGKVFEIFGPVLQPFYSVRFNSASEIDKSRVEVGRKVFYAGADPTLSTFVKTAPLRTLKGSDASNMHDEEVDEVELEFSDDEMEMEHKRLIKRKRTKKGRAQAADPVNTDTYKILSRPADLSTSFFESDLRSAPIGAPSFGLDEPSLKLHDTGYAQNNPRPYQKQPSQTRGHPQRRGMPSGGARQSGRPTSYAPRPVKNEINVGDRANAGQAPITHQLPQRPQPTQTFSPEQQFQLTQEQRLKDYREQYELGQKRQQELQRQLQEQQRLQEQTQRQYLESQQQYNFSQQQRQIPPHQQQEQHHQQQQEQQIQQHHLPLHNQPSMQQYQPQSYPQSYQPSYQQQYQQPQIPHLQGLNTELLQPRSYQPTSQAHYSPSSYSPGALPPASSSSAQSYGQDFRQTYNPSYSPVSGHNVTSNEAGAHQPPVPGFQGTQYGIGNGNPLPGAPPTDR